MLQNLPKILKLFHLKHWSIWSDFFSFFFSFQIHKSFSNNDCLLYSSLSSPPHNKLFHLKYSSFCKTINKQNSFENFIQVKFHHRNLPSPNWVAFIFQFIFWWRSQGKRKRRRMRRPKNLLDSVACLDRNPCCVISLEIPQRNLLFSHATTASVSGNNTLPLVRCKFSSNMWATKGGHNRGNLHNIMFVLNEKKPGRDKKSLETELYPKL